MRLTIDTDKIDSGDPAPSIERQIFLAVARELDDYGKLVLPQDEDHGKRIRKIASEIRWLIRSDWTVR